VPRLISILFLCLLAGASLCPGAPQPAAVQQSTVYFASDRSFMTGFDANTPAVAAMTDQLVMAVTGQKTVPGAWRSLVSPSDHIGIKIAAAGGRNFSSHQAIIYAVLRGLSEAGIPMSQVVIWDRTDPRAAGYQPFPGGPALRGIDPFNGYDPKSILTLPATGLLIWGDLDFHPRGPNPLDRVRYEQYSIQSHWSRLICGLNKIINIPVMSASEYCGMAGCMYNVTVPNLDNWRRFINPPQSGDPFLPELYSDSHVGPKVVLNLMDGLIAQYGGGPDWQPNYSWSHDTLYASKDPVAIDATALRLIDAWRKDSRLPSVTDQAKYLQTAAAMGLGNYDADHIALVREQR
jgi:hypothetical protein